MFNNFLHGWFYPRSIILLLSLSLCLCMCVCLEGHSLQMISQLCFRLFRSAVFHNLGKISARTYSNALLCKMLSDQRKAKVLLTQLSCIWKHKQQLQILTGPLSGSQHNKLCTCITKLNPELEKGAPFHFALTLGLSSAYWWLSWFDCSGVLAYKCIYLLAALDLNNSKYFVHASHSGDKKTTPSPPYLYRTAWGLRMMWIALWF